MSSEPEFTEALQEQILQQTVFGSPRQAGDTTVIPVARAQAPGLCARWLGKPKQAGEPLGFLALTPPRAAALPARRWLWVGMGVALLGLVLWLAGVQWQKQKKRPSRPALW